MTEETPQWEERIWNSPDGSGPFRLRLWYGAVDGRPGVVGVELWGVEPQLTPWTEQSISGAQIKASDIRLPLGKLLDERTVWLHTHVTAARSPELAATIEAEWKPLLAQFPQLQAEHDAKFAAAREAAEQLLRQRPERHRGRPAVPESRLRVVADRYQQAVNRGERAPALAVWDYFEAMGVKAAPATVRRWIGLARKRGYLPASRRRKSS